MMTKKTKIKLLRGALKVLDGGRHWTRDRYRNGDNFCLAGAMFESGRRQGYITERVVKTGDDDWTYVEYTDTLTDIVTEEIGTIADAYTEEVSLRALAEERGYQHVPAFNDDGLNTYQDIERFVLERIDRIEKETDDNNAD